MFMEKEVDETTKTLAKNVDMNKAKKGTQELFSYYVMNKISIPMVKFLAKHTLVTPNKLTIMSVPIAIIGCLLFLTSGFSSNPYLMRLLGSITIFIFYYLDTLDGKLARVKGQASLLGKLLDGVIMFAFLPLIFFSLAFGLRDVFYMIVGSLAMICYIVQFLMAYHFNLDIKPTLDTKGITIVSEKNKLQRTYGAAIFFPLLFLSCLFDKPEWLIIFYAIFGNFFWMLMITLQIKTVMRFEKSKRL
jgi:phosphatidylglycerophosphate synthase